MPNWPVPEALSVGAALDLPEVGVGRTAGVNHHRQGEGVSLPRPLRRTWHPSRSPLSASTPFIQDTLLTGWPSASRLVNFSRSVLARRRRWQPCLCTLGRGKEDEGLRGVFRTCRARREAQEMVPPTPSYFLTNLPSSPVAWVLGVPASARWAVGEVCSENPLLASPKGPGRGGEGLPQGFLVPAACLGFPQCELEVMLTAAAHGLAVRST